MKILVTGQYRSGSTWLFNACRLIANESGIVHKSIFFQSEVRLNSDNMICKTHSYYPDLANVFDKVITSTRPTEDVLVSMNNLSKRGVEEWFFNSINVDEIDEFVEWNEKWMLESDYVMQYDQMMIDKAKVIEDLKDILGVECDTNKILDELDKMRAPSSGFDPVTFMTSTHYKFI